MGKVYVFAGFMIVLAAAGLTWMIIAKIGMSMFKKKEKK
jgi:hypothetical protein